MHCYYTITRLETDQTIQKKQKEMEKLKMEELET